MDNYIWVVDHGGYTLSDDTGDFVLDGIPPGEYTLHVWHPGIRPKTAEGSNTPAAPTVNFDAPIVVGGTITVKEGAMTQLIVEVQ